ncbi:putative phosphatase regulatory subunit-domain-containing protein, partial [Amanita rubescens]
STPVLLVNGKPLKSSLKSSNSSPSLVIQPSRTRSEPTTPLLAQKNVHFPEGDLVSVRVFNRSARLASLSKPFGDDTETETETDNNGVAAWPAAASYFKSLAVAKPAKKSYQLDAEKCSVVPHKHEQLDRYSNVHLESLQLKSSPTVSPVVSCSILVRNVAFEKTVAVRFTLDNWQTTSEVLARHQASLARLPEHFPRSSQPKAPEWDRFSFTIKLEDYAQHLDQKTMWLVVRYTVPGSGEDSGSEWWDNNACANYKLWFRAASSSA